MESSGQLTVRLCNNCRNIDFQELLRKPLRCSRISTWLQPELADIPVSFPVKYSQNCKICELLLAGRPDFRNGQVWHVMLWLVSTCSPWIGHTGWTVPGFYDGVCIVVHDNSSRPDPWQLDFSLNPNRIFCTSSADMSQGLYRPRILQEIWDYEAAQSWLQTCLRCQHRTCNEPPPEVADMNLIYCTNMEIVRRRKSSRWICLSYVWGAQPGDSVVTTSFRVGARLSEDLPRTIAHAIKVTKMLDYRYLWFDEYCIDQSDNHHKTEQIARMDEIYKGADLTIVAAAGTEKAYGLPGVDQTRRKRIAAVCVGNFTLFSNGPDPDLDTKSSEWSKRAWYAPSDL